MLKRWLSVFFYIYLLFLVVFLFQLVFYDVFLFINFASLTFKFYKMKRTCLIFFCLLLAANMLAVPAYRGKIKVRQPDGTVLTFYMVGDERNHY